MSNDLSAKQKTLFQIIRDFQRTQGKSPTLGELKTLLKVPSANSVVQLLKKLEEKGYIEREKNTERGIKLTIFNSETIDVPIVGAATCGAPSILAEENIEGYIPVHKFLLGTTPKGYFFLRAIGDSMNLAGIQDGDMVLVKSQASPVPNGTVVALIGDEAVIKIFKPGNGYIALVPKSSNPIHKPIILHNDFTIQGVVKEVYKREVLQA